MSGATAVPIMARVNLAMPLAEGGHLATDVYHPRAGGPFPAILLRTPYGKAAHLSEGRGWARRGFAFVAQDVRGRYESTGVWSPYTDEWADGAVAVDWLARQPWCDGRVVVTGGSYAAFTAWAAALSRHPALRAVIALVPAMGLPDVKFDRSGILHLGSHAAWWVTHAEGRVSRPGLFEAQVRADPALLHELPVTALPQRLWTAPCAWLDTVLAGPDDQPAYTISDEELAGLNLPTLHLGGWHDAFIETTLHQWRVAGAAVCPRPSRGLIVGPWTHGLEYERPFTYGERDYGPASCFPLGRFQAAWLRRILGDTPQAPRAMARVFIAGDNRWASGPDWPLAPVTERAWYAGPRGTLTADPPTKTCHDTFRYDPATPFPARSQPRDRRDLLARADAVRYRTPTLKTPLTCLGSPRVQLHAATDGPGTDWVVRLLEHRPDGRLLFLCQGLVDAGREVERAGARLIPGESRRYTIILTPLAVTIPIGSRLCLEITSSDFPEHARNLNTGTDRYQSSATRTASQTVVCGGDQPTVLILPVATDTVSEQGAR